MASTGSGDMRYREQSIALQVGTYSNYIGTHQWNMRDDIAMLGEYDYNQLYRVTKSSNSSSGGVAAEDTYCPRALFFDTADNVGRKHPLGRPENLQAATQQQSLSKSSNSSKAHGHVAWGGETTTIVQGNSGGDNELNAQYWADFLEPHVSIHEKTLCRLPLWTHNQNFDLFSQGRGREAASLDCREDYCDRFRYFAEECDFLRNINVHCDAFSGFGGLAASLIEEISDDFGSSSILLWAATEPLQASRHALDEKNKNTRKMIDLNIPLLFSAVYDMVAVILPLNPRSVAAAGKYASAQMSECDALYNSSAVIACAVETLTSHQHLNDYGNFNKSSKEWLNIVSGGGRFKFLDVEISPLATQLDLLASCVPSGEATAPSSAESRDGARCGAAIGKASVINPFASISISPAASSLNSKYVYGGGERELRNNLHNDNTSDNEDDGGKEAGSKKGGGPAGLVRRYVNTVASRSTRTNFVDFMTLQQAYGSRGHMLSHLHQYEVPLYTSNGFAGLSSIASEDNSFCCAAAANASSLTGAYLRSVATTFVDNYKRIDEAALVAAELDLEGCREVQERLLEIAGRYDR